MSTVTEIIEAVTSLGVEEKRGISYALGGSGL
jgi:hypothetical protein